MFPSSAVSSGLSLSKIAGGISKTLGIVNQAIPIYKEVKPMAQKAGNLFSIYKEFKKAPSAKQEQPINNSSTYVESSNSVITNTNYEQTKTASKDLNPVFFQ